jgi:hypothetical protein
VNWVIFHGPVRIFLQTVTSPQTIRVKQFFIAIQINLGKSFSMDWAWAERAEFDSWQWQGVFSLSLYLDPLRGPPSLLSYVPTRKCNLPISGADINVWSHITISPYVFIAVFSCVTNMHFYLHNQFSMGREESFYKFLTKNQLPRLCSVEQADRKIINKR